MKPLTSFAGILLSVLFLNGCEEDVYTPTAKSPYPVVYCVINKNDTAHYLRLTKSFSGPVDATIMAQNPDSLYYKHARVYAEMLGKTVEMLPTREIPREPGVMFSDYSILYKTTYPLCQDVTIHIYLTDYGTEVIGETFLLDDPVFYAPDTTKKKVLSFFEPEYVTIRWNGLQDACQTIIRFKYLEISESEIDSCHLDWTRKSADFAILPEDLLDYINHWIKDNPSVRYRKVVGFDILVSTGNEQLWNYMKYKDWTIDYIEKPWSNVYNAYGLIASRVNGGLYDYLPNQKFLDTLANTGLTKHLKFVTW